MTEPAAKIPSRRISARSDPPGDSLLGVPGKRPIRWWRLTPGLVLLLLLAAVPLVFAARNSEDPPHYVRVIGDVAPLGYLNDPMGIAASPAEDGRVYVVDTANARIAVFSAEGQPVGAWGKRGTGRGRFWLPTDVAVSRDGRYVYVVDQVQAVIQRFEPRPECFEDGGQTCFAPDRVLMWGGLGYGDGAFQRPTGIAVDDAGNVYVSDAGSDNIQVFTGEGSHLRTFGESGDANGQLSSPTDLAIADEMLLVADRNNDRICYFTLKGEAYTYYNGAGRFFRPTGIAVDDEGGIAVRDYDPSFGTPRVWRFDGNRRLAWNQEVAGESVDYSYPLQGLALMPNGSLLLTNPTASEVSLFFLRDDGERQSVALRGRMPNQFDHPSDVAIDRDYDVVADPGNQRVLVLDKTDHTQTLIGGDADPDVTFGVPSGVAVHRYGEAPEDAVIYVADSEQSAVRKLSMTGDVLDSWGGWAGDTEDTFDAPEDVAVAPDGDVYVADTNNNRIVHRSADGQVLGIIGGDPELMQYPMSLAVGPLGLVYVVESHRNRVRAFSDDGEMAFEWHGEADPGAPAPGQFWLPVAIAADSQFVYVMESDRRVHVRVQTFTVEKEFPKNLFTIFADGAGASPGRLWDPSDLSVSDDGQILIADAGNNRVQLFAWPGSEPPATPTLTPTVPPPSPTPSPTRTPAILEPTDVPTSEPLPTDTPAERPTVDLPTNVAPTVEVQPTPTVPPTIRTIYLPFSIRR